MAGTYSQLLLHVVFSTKGRANWLKTPLVDRLYAYIGGIVRTEGDCLYEIGGMPDHVHLYLRWQPKGDVSSLVRTIKARSSKWVHDAFPTLTEFSWQPGYSVFSVSKSQEPVLIQYIRRQAAHHHRDSFADELRKLLQAHGIDFEEKHLVDH